MNSEDNSFVRFTSIFRAVGKHLTIPIGISLVALTISGITFYKTQLYDQPSVLFQVLRISDDFAGSYIVKGCKLKTVLVNDGTIDVLILRGEVDVAINDVFSSDYDPVGEVFGPMLLKKGEIKIVDWNLPDIRSWPSAKEALFQLVVSSVDSKGRRGFGGIRFLRWKPVETFPLESTDQLVQIFGKPGSGTTIVQVEHWYHNVDKN